MFAIGLMITNLAFILGKTKLMHVVSHKKRVKKYSNLNIRYGTVHIKEYHTVTYLGCVLDENLSGETMSMQVIKTINNRLPFLSRKNRFLSQLLFKFLCNAIMQTHFQYASSVWYTNLNKCLKKKKLEIF